MGYKYYKLLKLPLETCNNSYLYPITSSDGLPTEQIIAKPINEHISLEKRSVDKIAGFDENEELQTPPKKIVPRYSIPQQKFIYQGPSEYIKVNEEKIPVLHFPPLN